MVHGDVREEQELLEREVASSPDFMRIYLGHGALDRHLLAWLHERRLRDLVLADRVLVPSDHIAETLVRHGTPADKIRVIPYAADCRQFQPLDGKQPGRTARSSSPVESAIARELSICSKPGGESVVLAGGFNSSAPCREIWAHLSHTSENGRAARPGLSC